MVFWVLAQTRRLEIAARDRNPVTKPNPTLTMGSGFDGGWIIAVQKRIWGL